MSAIYKEGLRAKIRNFVSTTALVLSVLALLSTGCALAVDGRVSSRDQTCRELVVYNKSFQDIMFGLGIQNENFTCADTISPDEQVACLIEVDQHYLFMWQGVYEIGPQLAEIWIDKEQYDACMAGDDGFIPWISVKIRGGDEV